MLQVRSPLTESEEALVERVMDVGFSVHRVLGPGFREKIYQRAFCLELDARGLPFECEKRIEVRYKQWSIPGQTVDLVVGGIVLVELKAIPKLRALHRRQVLSYLKTMGLRIGLVFNFNTELMKHGFRRVVNQ
jgi:GxxExxY protein